MLSLPGAFFFAESRMNCEEVNKCDRCYQSYSIIINNMWRLLLLVACLQGALSLRVTRPSTSRIVRVDAGRQSWHARSSLHMIGDLHEPLLHAVSAMDTLFHSAHAPTEHLAWHSDAIHSNGLFLSDETSAAASPALNPSPSDVSVYSKVDKTGFIGFFANGIEICIDFVHTLLNGIGVQYSYGISIIMFTIFGNTKSHLLMNKLDLNS